MHGCHGCQEVLLDYLYELLDEQEQREVEKHLAGCSTCQQALQVARSQQQLLRRAARLSFPQVRFQPPADQPLAGRPAAASPLLPLPKRPIRPRFSTRWAVAAALLLAVSALGWPVFRAQQEYQSAEQVVRVHQQSLTSALRELESTRAEARQAAQQRDRALADLQRQIRERELRLVVSGPRSVQAGAAAEFQIEARDLTGQLAEAEVVAKVAAGTGPADPLAGEMELPVQAVAPGRFRVRIPPTIRLQSGHSLDMLVMARKKMAGAAASKEAQPVRVAGRVQLTAPLYLTHLTTDKPLYQPGEVVRFRSLTLERDRLAPTEQEFQLHYTLTTPTGAVRTVARGRSQLLSDGKPVLGPDGKPVRGLGAGEIALEADLPGGEYTLTVSEESGRFAPVSRKFLVNSYQKPRLDKKLDFNRASYGPSDEVQARVTARRADGAPVDNQNVEAVVLVDGQQIGRDGRPSATPLRLRTDGQGSTLVRFRLPAQIERGEVSLAVTFRDADVIETIVRPVPVVLDHMQLEFFPEGGDLVAGLVNRVYFQARTPLGKPAQLVGELLEDGRPTGVRVATLHDDQQPGVNQGQGAFQFTPQAGKFYQVRITTPAGITRPATLPTVQPDGVVLHVPGGVFAPTSPIRVQIRSTRPRSLIVGAYCRGQLLDLAQLQPGQTEVELRPTVPAGGVCRVTVFEEMPGSQTQKQLRPVAERLVYRQPAQRLDVSITPDQRRYTPGQKVQLALTTRDETGKPAPALALVGVVDGSVIHLADERTARSLPTYFLLTTEVRRADDLEHADFLLTGQPRAAEALDLLLGTQGWRRFAEQNPTQFQQRLQQERNQKPGDSDRQRDAEDGERLLVMIGQGTPRITDLDESSLARIEEDYARQLDQLQNRRKQVTDLLQRADRDESYQAALLVLARFDHHWQQWRSTGLPLVGLGLIVLALVGLAASARRQPTVAWGCGLATAAGLLAIALWPGEQAHHRLAERAEQLAWMDRVLKEPQPQLEKELARNIQVDDALRHERRDAPVQAAMPVMPGRPLVQARRPVMRGAENNRERAEGRDAFRADQQRQQARNLVDRPARPEGKQVADLPPVPPLLPADRKALLREQMERQAFPGRAARDLEAEPPAPPLVVREYAHTRSAAVSDVRSDFTETVYWHPVLILNDGSATVSFDLPDSVTSFQAKVWAHTLDGRLGAATQSIESRLPFSLSPRVPIEVTSSDRIDVPVSISNTSDQPQSVTVNLSSLTGLEMANGPSQARFEVPGLGRMRQLFSLRPTLRHGQASLQVRGTAGPFSDAIRETIRVVPDGFPVTQAVSDLLEGSATHKIRLPQWLPGTLTCRVEVYPSTLADVQKGLAGLLGEPHGCFEQSSTANYPNVLALDYLRTTRQADPELERRTRDLLERGYQKLTSFECLEPTSGTRRGYEWFGGTAAPHEALTAYGLMQFRDMASVYPVDRTMLERTRAYLLAQRDGKGGFRRNDRALDTFGRAPQDITNAYIVWALTESSHEDDLSVELDALTAQASKSEDAYFLALVALGQANRGRLGEARKLLDRLVKAQKADGHLEAATSITSSGGRDLHIETTALALLGWLKVDRGSYALAIRNGLGWLGKQRGGSGTFGSTQATILALKALLTHARQEQKVAQAGELRLFIGDQLAGELRFPAGARDTLVVEVPQAETLLKPGDNTLRVEITGKDNHFPHTLSFTYRTAQPLSKAAVPVTLHTRLANSELREGQSVRLDVQVRNTSGKDQGMAVAVVGLPGGLSLPENLEQLRNYCRVPDKGRPQLGAFEVQGRELILYWRDLAKDQVINLPIDLIARIPGSYRGPASRAYLYYNADDKHWVEPLKVSIVP